MGAKFRSYNPQCSIIPIWHSLALGQIRIIEHFGLYDTQLCSHIIPIYVIYFSIAIFQIVDNSTISCAKKMFLYKIFIFDQ